MIALQHKYTCACQYITHTHTHWLLYPVRKPQQSPMIDMNKHAKQDIHRFRLSGGSPDMEYILGLCHKTKVSCLGDPDP